MMTVHEVSKLSGISIRTLQYYDSIGLLKPADYTEAGYRLYDDASLEKLQIILLFRELEFPLKDIKKLIENPNFDTGKALDQQMRLLELRREHIDNLLNLAKGLKKRGADNLMDFSAFDKKKMEQYAEEAKRTWGDTDAYKEYVKRKSIEGASVCSAVLMRFAW